MKKKKLCTFYLLLVVGGLAKLSFVLSIAHDELQTNGLAMNEQSNEWITVFVHGTFGIQSNLNIGTLIRLWQDNIDYSSSYFRNVQRMRAKQAYYALQPMQELGLKKIIHDLSAHRGPYLFSLIFNEILHMYEQQPSRNNNYTFGWSGLVSVTHRLEESRCFYHELRNEIERLRQIHGHVPKIRLISYSHGGSLCLNLALIRKTEFPQDSFAIDELTLIGVPIQKVTSCFVHDPMFKKVYNISSAGDNIQRLDFFTPCDIFSHKKFHSSCNQELPDKLKQIEIQMSTAACKRHSRIGRSPGHIELWFFGWTTSLYRRSFPLYPLPVAVFIPYITTTVDQNISVYPKKITFQIHPDSGQSFLSTCADNQKKCVPFISCNELDQLREKALSMHPNVVIEKSKDNQNIPVLIKPALRYR